MTSQASAGGRRRRHGRRSWDRQSQKKTQRERLEIRFQSIMARARVFVLSLVVLQAESVESLASQPGLAGLRRDNAPHAGRFQC